MKGHPVVGAISGFFFGVFLAMLLLTTGVLATDSVVIGALPWIGLILGIILAAVAPFKRSRLQTAPAAAGPAPLADVPPPAAAPPPTAPPPAEAPPQGGGRLHADPVADDDPPAGS